MANKIRIRFEQDVEPRMPEFVDCTGMYLITFDESDDGESVKVGNIAVGGRRLSALVQLFEEDRPETKEIKDAIKIAGMMKNGGLADKLSLLRGLLGGDFGSSAGGPQLTDDAKGFLDKIFKGEKPEA